MIPRPMSTAFCSLPSTHGHLYALATHSHRSFLSLWDTILAMLDSHS